MELPNFTNPETNIAILGVHEGMVVADLDAGTETYTVLLAEKVGWVIQGVDNLYRFAILALCECAGGDPQGFSWANSTNECLQKPPRKRGFLFLMGFAKLFNRVKFYGVRLAWQIQPDANRSTFKKEKTMKNGTYLKTPGFLMKLGILIGFIVEVATAIFMQMTDAELQYYLGKKEYLRKKLHEMFNQTDLHAEQREGWRKLYQKHFSLDINVADICIPEKPMEGDWRLIIVAHGLTLNQAYDRMSKAFKCWKYAGDLDASVTKNARDTKETYAIWVRVGVEPDEKYLGKSAKQADPDMKIGVTFLERMLLELVYFDETGKHLDVVGWTRCTGSRYSDGNVPSMDWGGGEVRVGWGGPDGSNALDGLREAVS